MSYRSTKATCEGFLTVGTNRKEGAKLLETLSHRPFTFAVVHCTKQPKTNLKSYVMRANAPKEIPFFTIGDKRLFETDEK